MTNNGASGAKIGCSGVKIGGTGAKIGGPGQSFGANLGPLVRALGSRFGH